MCATEEQIKERLRDLPEVPNCLMSFVKEGEFHGIIEWEVKKGQMMSFPLLDHNNCGVLHTKFSRNSELNWHNHGKETEEIIICLEGEITIILQDGTKTVLKEKDRFIIGREIQHTAIVGSKPCQVLAITIPKEKL